LRKTLYRNASLTSVLLLLAAAASAQPGARPRVDCSRFVVSGNPQSAAGATWTYHSTDFGVAYALEGILFVPSVAGPFPGVVVSHGKNGTPYAYSAGVAPVMVGWGMVVIGTMYTHAPDAQDAGNLPDGPDGASDANVARAIKTRDLLACVGGVDLNYVAAHGHSMGAFVTGQLLGRHPGAFRAASHTAGGVSQGPNATTPAAAQAIRTPYQLHHSAADTTVPLILGQTLAQILAGNQVPHALFVAEYPGYTHAQIAHDPAMLERVRGWYQAYGVLP
jgi:dienelactone hydrolase